MSVALGNAHVIRLLLAAFAGATLAILAGACGDDEAPPEVTATAITGATTTPPADATTGAAATTAAEPASEAPPAEPPSQPASEPEAAPEPSDDEQIRTVLNGVLVAGVAKQTCTQLLTENFVRRAYGDLKGCFAAQAPKAMAKAISIQGIDIDPGDRVAMASVVSNGGLYAGERLRAELVDGADGWQLDYLRANVPVGP